MKGIVIGYLHSGNLDKDTELFLKIADARKIKVILLDIAKNHINEEISKLDECDIIYDGSGEEFSVEWIKKLEDRGKKVVESSKAISDENKWNFYLKCVKHKIPMPETILLSSDIETAKEELVKFGKWPVVLKRVVGTWGEFVERAMNIDEAVKIIDEFDAKSKVKYNKLAQEFVASFSYRLTYIGDEIVQTAIKENNSWKCTGVYAKSFKKFDVDDELRDITEKIMKMSDVKVGGIDLLKKDGKWLVIELNTMPALDFFEDEREMIVGKIIDFLLKSAKSETKVA